MAHDPARPTGLQSATAVQRSNNAADKTNPTPGPLDDAALDKTNPMSVARRRWGRRSPKSVNSQNKATAARVAESASSGPTRG